MLKKLVYTLNAASKKNKSSLRMPSRKMLTSLLVCLQDYGLIDCWSFKHLNENKVIFIQLKPLKFFITIFQNYSITKDKLVEMVKKYPTSVFVINTSAGIICHKKAFKLNKFGKLIASVRLVGLN